MISARTWAVFSNASSSSARHASFFGFSTRFWAINGRLRSSSVIVWNRPSQWRQHVGEVELLHPGHVVANQVPQITLASHEADDRHRAFGLAGLDQLGKLVPLGLHEAQIRRVGRQPEDQFVEEEDQPVVTERLGVGTDDRQAHVQIDVGFVLPLGDSRKCREDILHQVANQAAAFVTGGRGFEGGVETGGIPALGEFAPARTTSAFLALVQLLEELLVSKRLPMLLGVLEDGVGQIDAR